MHHAAAIARLRAPSRTVSIHARLLALALASGGLATPGLAEDAAGAAVDQLQQVVVTARKRAENVQEVPIAITTVSESQLRQYGAGQMSELVQHVPNFDWDPVGFNALSSWGLRGIVATSRNAGQESGLAIYQDGVFIGRPTGFNVSLLDVDHIEVLRGPQGTLYGRNTIAGAINITSRRPTDQLGVAADLNVGNYSRVDADAEITGPIIPGTLRGKFGAYTQENDGYVRNLAGQPLLSENRKGGRGALYFEREHLEVILAGDVLHENHRTAFGLAADPQLALALPNYYFTDPYVTNQNDPNFEKIDAGGGSLTVNWTLPTGQVFTSITADRINNFDLDNDDDAGPITLTHSHFVDKSAMFSQELRIASASGGRYDYVAGLYYLDENVRTHRHTAVVPWPAENVGIVDAGKVGTRSYAAFASGNLHLTEVWTLGAGLRYTNDRKDSSFTQTVNVPLGFKSPLYAFPSSSRDDKQVSGDVTLSFKPHEHYLAYATVRRGFKSGGFQTDIIDFSNPDLFNYKPETATTYEIGSKSDLLGNTLRANVALFDTEYKDMQVSQLVGLGFTTVNAGKSRIRGAEAELAWLPVRQLSLSLSGGFLDAKYLEFPNCDPLGLGTDCSGNRLQFTPRWNIGTSVDYRQPVTSWGVLMVHADSSSRDAEFSDALNSDGARKLGNGATSWPLRIGGYTLVGARLGLESADQSWGVYLWGKNLSNHVYDLRRWRYPIIPLAFGAVGAQGIEFVPGQPRTYGVEFRYRH